MHDVACKFARAAVRSKDAQKQLARTSLKYVFPLLYNQETFTVLKHNVHTLPTYKAVLS